MVRKTKGLNREEVIISREKHGDNSLTQEKTKGFFKKFIENLSDPIIKVLIIAVVIEIIFTFGNCNWLEVIGIITAVLIATVVSTASEYGSEVAFKKMQEENDGSVAKVLRDGVLVKLPINELVVGDTVYVEAGENIPADGVIIEGKLSLDQSALNGESVEAIKYPTSHSEKKELSAVSRVFRGSLVTQGSGKICIDGVGNSTYYGMVAKDVQSETRESPLKHRLGALASQISRLGYIMAVIVGLTYLFFAYVVDNSYNFDAIISSFKNLTYVITTLTHALTLMITVVVVAVPEGLPMMITVVLSANMKRMLKDNIMVKKLVGIETAGSMNILFTDKTGTLTTGKTTCEEFITVGEVYKSPIQMRGSVIHKYLTASAGIDKSSREIGNTPTGNSTDVAFLKFFEKEPIPDVKIISAEPFSSDKKYSSVLLQGNKRIIRGAPEIILPVCVGAVCDDGNIKSFDRGKIEAIYKERASSGGRVVAVSLLDENLGKAYFVALAVLKDKVRQGTRAAVEAVLKAGVRVVMITGDSKETATAIGVECGILRKGYTGGVITHSELEAMTDEELKKHLPTLRVIARALPQDKTRLVRVCQEENLVVGMTGDGVNDAPSLKLADVGFAMGSGTDIAKAAGDIIILDNSFMAISKTILYGRTIFKSIKKFISFQLMMNLAACGVSLLGQFVGIDNPITIIQMLWINIIMDTLGGLAFSGEPPLDYYMLEKPKSRDEKILSRDMLSQIVFTGGYTLLLCVSFLYFDFFKSLFAQDQSDMRFLTGFYALFVFAGLFNCFNARSERMWIFSNIGKNKLFLLILAFIAVIQVIMIYFSGDVFRCTALSPRELLNVILIAFTVVPFDMLRRVFKKLTR